MRENSIGSITWVSIWYEKEGCCGDWHRINSCLVRISRSRLRPYRHIPIRKPKYNPEKNSRHLVLAEFEASKALMFASLVLIISRSLRLNIIRIKKVKEADTCPRMDYVVGLSPFNFISGRHIIHIKLSFRVGVYNKTSSTAALSLFSRFHSQKYARSQCFS